jgi:oligopeptide/dipeptide ABC transporter ATP-binding protein
VTPLLSVEDLHTHFFTRKGVVEALRGVSFRVGAGEIVGLVGESGSGKSVTAASILGLVRPPGRIVRGRIVFDGHDLTASSEREMRDIRGSQIGLVLQSPRTALNPLLSVGDQMVNVYRSHVRASRNEARKACLDMLEAVGLSDVERRARSYPREFSGGSAQRVLIAIALLCRPKLLLADEPTTALDVTIQAQILRLLQDSITRTGSSALLITHDLGVVAHFAQRTLVMFRGEIIEQGPTAVLVASSAHPYTAGLIEASSPRRSSAPGVSPPRVDQDGGCVYADHCPLVHARCLVEPPASRRVGVDHWASCHLAKEDERHPAA